MVRESCIRHIVYAKKYKLEETKENRKMEELLKILKSYNEDVDFLTAQGIIDDELIDSIDVTSLISELEDVFGIEIGMDDIIPDNFNTAEAMWNMVQRLQG